MSAAKEHQVVIDGATKGPTSPGDPLSAWVKWAACAGRPAMFDDPERANEALRLCARCPVLVECRLWALLNAVEDRHFLSQLARGGAEVVREKFDLRVQARRLEDVYLRIIGTGGFTPKAFAT